MPVQVKLNDILAYGFVFIQEANWKPMNFEGQTDQLQTLCGEMESCGIDNFNELVVGKYNSEKLSRRI